MKVGTNYISSSTQVDNCMVKPRPVSTEKPSDQPTLDTTNIKEFEHSIQDTEHILLDQYSKTDDYIIDIGQTSQDVIPEYHGGVQGIWIREEFTTVKDGYLKRYNESNLGGFYTQAFEFFRNRTDTSDYWQNRNEYERSLNTALQELANQISTGNGNSLDTLTSKVNINGNEMTLYELHKIHEVFFNASEGIYDAMRAGYGENQEFSAIHALAVVSVRKGLSDAGLKQEIVEFAANAYEDRVDGSMRNYADSLAKVYPATDYSGSSSNKTASYYSAINFDFDKPGSFHYDIYNSFKRVDISSDKSFEDDFTKIYSWYKNHMQIWNDKNGGLFKPGQLRSAAEKSLFLLELKRLFFKSKTT